MKNTKYKATLALGAAALGAAASYPYSAGLAGGLIHSGCWAAMVGGLADWFAVTALFRKPLGFSYRTAIIPRNRERIFQDLADFIGEDLLTPENIMKTVTRYDTAALVIRYLDEYDGRAQAKRVVRQLLQDAIVQLDEGEAGKLLEDFIKENAASIRWSPLLAQALDWTLRNRYDDQAVAFLLRECTRAAAGAPLAAWLRRLFDGALAAYEKKMLRRQAAIGLLGITPEQLADEAQAALIRYLEALQDADHPRRRWLRAWLRRQAAGLRRGGALEAKAERWIGRFVYGQLRLARPIERYIAHLRQAAAAGSAPAADWIAKAERAVDWLARRLKDDPARRAALDARLKEWLESFFRRRHDDMMQLVRERLQEFSDEKLVAFIEERVGNDLQMIRINGSVVGGLAGMALYLLTAGVERLWGG